MMFWAVGEKKSCRRNPGKFFKRCKLINYERLGKNLWINDTLKEKKKACIKLKTHDQNTSDSLKKKEREGER